MEVQKHQETMGVVLDLFVLKKHTPYSPFKSLKGLAINSIVPEGLY